MLLGRATTLISSLPGIKSTNSIKDVCPQWVELLRQEPFLEQWTLTTTTRKGSFWIIKFQELQKKKKKILRREKGRQWIWKRNVCFSTHISGQQESPCWKESRECASCSEGKMGGCEGSMVESLQENVVTGLLFMSWSFSGPIHLLINDKQKVYFEQRSYFLLPFRILFLPSKSKRKTNGNTRGYQNYLVSLTPLV